MSVGDAVANSLFGTLFLGFAAVAANTVIKDKDKNKDPLVIVGDLGLFAISGVFFYTAIKSIKA
jgi:CRISPR/Cas system CMR-associated protein Cmr3 (group 5 of RAMP superfamily)